MARHRPSPEYLANAVTELTATLRDPDGTTDDRELAAYHLGRLGEAAEPAVPALLDHAREVNGAQDALARLGPVAVPHLAAVLGTGQVGACDRALEALARIGPPANLAALDAALGLLRLGAVELQVLTLGWLDRFGPDAALAAPDLFERLGDPADRCRDDVLAFLRRLGPPAMPDLVLPLLADWDAYRRLAAADVLTPDPHHAEEVVPVLAALSEEADPVLGREARRLLREFHPADQLLAEPDAALRDAVGPLVDRYRDRRPRQYPELLQALADPADRTAQAAWWALRILGEDGLPARLRELAAGETPVAARSRRLLEALG